MRLTAPEGGFLIEPATAETQWILDRPSFLGEEAFGTWAWTAMPNETGSFVLALWVSARDLDANGVLDDLQFPGHAINVRVGSGFWRPLWGFLRTVLLLLAGGGLAAGAWYALKLVGKLPQ